MGAPPARRSVVAAWPLLPSPAYVAIVASTMLKWSTRPVLILLLGLMFILGQSSSALRAGEMAVKSAISVAADDMAPMPCHDCDHHGGQAKATDCQPACASVSLALLPTASSLAIVDYIREPAPEPRPLTGRTTRPEPHPPKRLISA